MNVYTVGQVNAYIKNMFTQDYFLHSVIVSGEVSNLKYHSSGHIYFTMKDESGILSAVMFRQNARKMPFKLENGDKIEAAGSVSIYEKSGSYQLYVNDIQKAGAGDEHAELEKLKQKLEEMGVFDPMYKKSVPKYCFRVGVVTSPTGSVIHDIRQVAARRNPGVEIVLVPASVQGEGAAASVISGIQALEKECVDVIIIARGGGSDEDLSAFNDEALAMAVFECMVPIVSAVGHGDDVSITDLAADVHAPTPSAAAELTVFLYEDFVREVNMCCINLERIMAERIERARQMLHQSSLRMDALSPQARIAYKRLSYEKRLDGITSLMRSRLDRAAAKMLIYIEKYKALSPVEKIEHGYAAVTDKDGKKITSVTQVKPGDSLKIIMRRMTMDATVDKVEERQEYDA